MSFTTPQTFIIAETIVNPDALSSMLKAVGVEGWNSDAYSPAELLTEVAGKLCYMSFDTALNKNLTKTGTRNNYDYIQDGLIATKHGSVLEHATVTFAFIDVSRVFTHELVRHRAGAAYSQTSGRYVRTDKLKFFLPSVFRENPQLETLFAQAITSQEAFIKGMEIASNISNMTAREHFSLKKKLTSAFRRLIGNGVANNIIATFNHRTLRHLIQMRTSRHAEEEIRLVFNQVADLVIARYPAIYADFSREMIEGYWEYTFKSEKV